MKIMTAVAAAVLASIISATGAQAQTTMYACYVKNTGTVYRIKTTGAPTKCSSNHTEFSWNEAGQQGPQGEVGPQGTQGPSGWPGVVVRMVQKAVFAGDPVDIQAKCGPGEIMLSGGYFTPAYSPNFRVVSSYPLFISEGAESEYGWQIRIWENLEEGIGMTVRVYAYCRKPAT